MVIVNVDGDEYLPERKDVKALGPSADSFVAISRGRIDELGEEKGVEEVGWGDGRTEAGSISCL